MKHTKSWLSLLKQQKNSFAPSAGSKKSVPETEAEDKEERKATRKAEGRQKYIRIVEKNASGGQQIGGKKTSDKRQKGTRGIADRRQKGIRKIK